jgi:hypothetical protein
VLQQTVIGNKSVSVGAGKDVRKEECELTGGCAQHYPQRISVPTMYTTNGMKPRAAAQKNRPA